MGQNAPMFGHAAVRNPAPVLAWRAMGLRLRLGPTALGNALGESIKDATISSARVTDLDEASRQAAAQRWDSESPSSVDFVMASAGEYFAAVRSQPPLAVLAASDEFQVSDGTLNGSLTSAQRAALAAGYGPLTAEAASAKIAQANGIADMFDRAFGDESHELAPAVQGPGLPASGRASMNEYWSQVADDGVSEGSFLKYLAGRTMQMAGNVGYSLADMGVAVYNNPEQSVAGGLKSIANLGPEVFNGATNLVKTSLNGYSMLAERLGVGYGTFAGFRESDAYNITPLFGYDNQAQAGGALLTQVALGVGMAKYGDYDIELNTGAPGALYANPFPLKLSARTTPGTATFGDDLVSASGRWLDAGSPAPIPLQVARQLEGQTFNRFDDLRAAVWRSVAADADLSAGFGRASLAQMREGNAPFAPIDYQLNASDAGMRFNLHHVEPVASGGLVYDLSNIQIVSPKVHFGIHN